MLTNQAYLGDLIRDRVPLGRLSGTGFHEQRCAMCHDHSARAGWKIEPDSVFYNCYNCGFKAWYEEGTGNFNRWMKELCRANGITDAELQAIGATLFFNKGQAEKEITLDSLKKVSLHTPEVGFPDRTMRLGSDGHDALQEPLIEYLIKRKVDPLKFYFSLDPAHLRRVIIPFWRDGKLIYWQSRAIDNDVKPRYRNCSASKDAIIYGYDHLFSYEDGPLFATEGCFDAESIDGICILGSSLNAAKIELLHKTKRRIIFVVDKDKVGTALGDTVLKENWEVTRVNEDSTDVNDSVQKFGKAFTMYTLMKNATTSLDKLYQKQIKHGLDAAFSNMRRPKWK